MSANPHPYTRPGRTVHEMRSRLVPTLVLVLALALGACAATPGGPTTSASSVIEVPVAPDSEAPDPTVVDSSMTSEATEEDVPASTTPPVPDGPPAPDFTLALADGRSFTLSEEAKPVFMIFWAEW